MSIYTIINLICNSFTSFSAFTMLINIFGDPTNKVWQTPIKAWIAKTGLTITTCGALWNIYILSTPSMSEILSNIGVSVSLFLLSWWQWENFKDNKKHLKKNYKKSNNDTLNR